MDIVKIYMYHVKIIFTHVNFGKISTLLNIKLHFYVIKLQFWLKAKVNLQLFKIHSNKKPVKLSLKKFISIDESKIIKIKP